jgi:SAM-dependent methyltransferase
VDPIVKANQSVWNAASQKHVREYQEHLDLARDAVLFDHELAVLGELLRTGPVVVHLQSGQGVDDHGLVHAGARTVTSVDYSAVAASAAQRRADELNAPINYVIAEVPRTPLADGCADLVYTGKGALMWLSDLDAWAAEVTRLLRPGGHFFVHESHPAIALWSWDEDEPRIRPDRSYFADQLINDSFPANGAIEWQWTLGQIVNALVNAGLVIDRLDEHPEPFWKPGDGYQAAAWNGRLPNTFSLLAHRPA